MTRYKIRLALAVFALAALCSFAGAQEASTQSVNKAAEAVVTVLTGTGSGITNTIGSGVIIRGDGVVLTAYHVVKDASQVQLRLKNGEIYDKVDLLGFDERRDVAALKIPATNLASVEVRTGEPAAAEKVFVVSSPQALSWTVADGSFSSMRMADDVPGAGHGYRVMQFSVPISSGSSGGLLLDGDGKALGIIVGSLSQSGALNFAVPMMSVSALGNTAQAISSFGRGTSLELPQAVRPPVNADLMSADPKAILKNAKFIYIYGYSDFINEQMMENALMKLPEWEKWKLIIVKDAKLADIKVRVEHDLFTWDYRYSVEDKRTDILLGAGKVTAWDGLTAAKKFAKEIVDKLRPGRESLTPEKENKADAKKDAKPKTN